MNLKEDFIRIGAIKDLVLIGTLYDEVNDYLEKSINYNYPTWKKGEYPNSETAKEAIINEELFVMDLKNEIIGAVILNHKQYDGYEKAPWGVLAQDDKILVINTLVTSPRFRGKGIGKKLVEFSIDFGKKVGMKSIRMSTYSKNIPAIKLYEKCKFISRGVLSADFNGEELHYAMFEYIY